MMKTKNSILETLGKLHLHNVSVALTPVRTIYYHFILHEVYNLKKPAIGNQVLIWSDRFFKCGAVAVSIIILDGNLDM